MNMGYELWSLPIGIDLLVNPKTQNPLPCAFRAQPFLAQIHRSWMHTEYSQKQTKVSTSNLTLTCPPWRWLVPDWWRIPYPMTSTWRRPDVLPHDPALIPTRCPLRRPIRPCERPTDVPDVIIDPTIHQFRLYLLPLTSDHVTKHWQMVPSYFIAIEILMTADPVRSAIL